MARMRYKPEEIVGLLRQVEVLHGQGMSMADAIRQLGISEVTYYRWRKEYGGMSGDQLRRLSGAKESLNNPMFAVSRGRGGLDVKLDDIADRPGAALVTGYGANGRYPRRSASFPAVPPAAGGLLPCHPVA